MLKNMICDYKVELKQKKIQYKTFKKLNKSNQMIAY